MAGSIDLKSNNKRKVAVLIPCYNEEITIANVIKDFSKSIPEAAIFVYDNNSKDNTIKVARDNGAIVKFEALQGKGNVVRRMFSDIEADIYILVDGDDTYHADSVNSLVNCLIEGPYDMVNASREMPDDYRKGHRFGNKLLSSMVTLIFGNQLKDVLSGYRVFSRRFVKSFPALSNGFEIETELTVHALELRMPVFEIKTPYKDRPEGSHSKLNTIKDGFKILKTILLLLKDEKPFLFFSTIGSLLFIAALILSYPLLITYIDTGLVPRFPTAILSTGLTILSVLSFICGLILDTVSLGRREMKRLHYLRHNIPN